MQAGADTVIDLQFMASAEQCPDASSPSGELPELPPEVWRAVARATFAACGSSLDAWLRLRTVSRDWHQGLEGARHCILLCTGVAMRITKSLCSA